MKALFFSPKRLFFALVLGMAAMLLCCAPAGAEEAEEDAPSGMAFTVYSAQGEPRTELFYEVCASAHATACVSAHAVDEATARELLDGFEQNVCPKLAAPSAMGERKLMVLLTCMEGQVYGYTPFPQPRQGPMICLNALYPEALPYALAHEYQHLCAYDACGAGGTALSEETDELLSDVFCEELFPDWGLEHGVLSEERARIAREALGRWGADAVAHAHDLLREGYRAEELLLAMENR